MKTLAPTTLFKKKIGIIGGGQLAKFLAQEAHHLGLTCYILSAHPLDPAAQVTSLWLQGHPDRTKDIQKLAKLCDIITFESEFVDIETINSALKSTNCKALPRSEIMFTLRDRWLQKQWLVKNNIPTAAFKKLDSCDVQKGFPKGCVIKQCTHGYDGYGTFIFKDSKKVAKQKFNQKFQYIVEEYIAFKRELALTAFRSANGDIMFFPLVETLQKNAQCFWVKGPIVHKNILAIKAKIKLALKNADYVGAITFELFETKNNNLIVNEVAPRVHNSAHHSLTSTSMNQFKSHLLCLIGAPLPKSPSLRAPGFAMLNLIGSGRQQTRAPQLLTEDLFWYNKNQNKKFRKMGHVNTLAASANKALNKLLKIEKEFKL